MGSHAVLWHDKCLANSVRRSFQRPAPFAAIRAFFVSFVTARIYAGNSDAAVMNYLKATDYRKMASDYAKHRSVHPGVLQGILSHGSVSKSSNVLEVGCGTGNYIAAIHSLLGCHCWGSDPSEEMLSKAGARPNEISWELGSAEKLDFPADFFNLVFSVDVIHHVSDRQKYFQDAHRVLKPEGKVCTVTDSEWIIQRRTPLTTYFPETAEVDLERYPKVAGLKESMTAAGFAELEETVVEFPYELRDIQPYKCKVFSSLRLISEEAFQRGIAEMEKELQRGPISCVSRYLLLWGRKGYFPLKLLPGPRGAGWPWEKV